MPSLRSTSRPGSVAAQLAPICRRLLGPDPACRFECWDGSSFGPDDARTVIRFRSSDALRRIVWAPGELGLARAFVAGDIDVDGDIFDFLALRERMGSDDDHVELRLGWRGALDVVAATVRLGAIGPPLPRPEAEARLHGRRHTRARDAAAIAHHYDVGNAFYRLVLGPSLTYSCAYWAAPGIDLAQAQAAKYELISRKLALEPGMRLLDVGCGWGGMVLHAAEHHGVEAVGITLSHEQAELARSRVKEAGLDDRVEVRVQDYRAISDGPFDAISSIGMFEHVGLTRMAEYLSDLKALLRPRGRLLNHAISRPTPEDRPAINPRSFIGRYVFPDGELLEVGTVVSAMQRLGLEVRDVESLREHYGTTLRAWVANLEQHWDEAVPLVGPQRARVWRLYMAGSAIGFEVGRTNVHQVLAVATDAEGRSDIPRTRTWAVPFDPKAF